MLNLLAQLMVALPAVASPAVAASPAESPIPVESRQMILSVSAGWDARRALLQAYERRSSNDSWVAVGDPIEASLGRTGLAWGRGLHAAGLDGPQKREGDGKSPAGVFNLRLVTGYGATAPAGTGLPYREATATLRCVDDVRSRFYNRLVDEATVVRDWSSAEDMRRSDDLYRLVVWVGHNDAPVVPGGGSCIFLHLRSGPGSVTSGCTAFESEPMERLLRWLDPRARPVLVQLPQAERAARAGEWGLPSAQPRPQEPTLLSALGLEPVAWAEVEVQVPDKPQWLVRAGIPVAAANYDRGSFFHVVDVDADGHADVVFDGPDWRTGPAEPPGIPSEPGRETRLFRNTGTRFVPWFGPAHGYRVAALVPGAPPAGPRLVLEEEIGGGECPTTLGLQFLRPSGSAAAAALVVDKEVRYAPRVTQWPRSPLPSPVGVRVTQDRYNLRYAPSVDDSTTTEFCGLPAADYRGNVVASFGRGATATALAQLREGARLWYFVMTDPGSAFTTAFPGLGGWRGGLMGWMSARYLETIPAEPPTSTSSRPPRSR